MSAEIGDALRIDATRLLSDVALNVASTQRRLLTWTITSADDVLTVLDDVRKVRDALDAVDSAVRKALREMPT
jgi:hypothetical protein